jgi:HD-like signal output (HDOD) protein
VNRATAKLLQKRVSDLRNLPAMPAVLDTLGECLNASPSEADVRLIVDLISCDKSLAAQCLRLANSPLLRGRTDVESIHSAVMSLGLRRIRDIVYSCSLPGLFSGLSNGMQQDTFWRHALGTALVCQRLAHQLEVQNTERFYLAGLLHDVGILANALLFEKEFQQVLQSAALSETPLCEVEQKIMGFTHSESGRILADIWKLPPDISGAIEFHHHLPPSSAEQEMTCVVSLADLLCRLRGLGYGYYEAREFDLVSEPAWQILQQKYPAAARMDVARFTLELDQYAIEVREMINMIFAGERTKS